MTAVAGEAGLGRDDRWSVRERVVTGSSPMSERSRWMPAAVGAVVLAGVLAGCGGGTSPPGAGPSRGGAGMMGGTSGMMSGAPATTPGGSPPPTATTAPRSASGQDGRALFLGSGCGGCHTLAAAGSTGTVGPDLDQVRPSYQVVVRWATDGGGGMPSFDGSLSSAQIRAVARFVSGAAG